MKHLFYVLLLIPLYSYGMVSLLDNSDEEINHDNKCDTPPQSCEIIEAFIQHFIESKDYSPLKEVYVINDNPDKRTSLIFSLIPKQTRMPESKKRRWYYCLLCCN